MSYNYIKKSFWQANNQSVQKKTLLNSNNTFITVKGVKKVIKDQSVLQTSSANVLSILVGLESDPSIIAKDKYNRARAIYAKWKYKDIEELVEEEGLLLWQKCRIKVILVKWQLPDNFSYLNWGVDIGAIFSTLL